jgi:hypothetical protein
MSNSIFNPALVGLADLKVKAAFVDAAAAGGGDPAAAGGGDPAAAGGDPMAAMGGGDPAAAAAGGAPAGPDPMAEINMLKQQIASMGAGGGGMGGGMEPIKPKIDVNVEIMQIKKMLARVVDSLGIQIPAAEMTATSTDLTQMAQQSQAAGAGGGAAAPSAIQPPAPIQAAAPGMDGGKQSGYNGRVFDPAFAPLASGSSLATEASRLLNALKSAG